MVQNENNNVFLLTSDINHLVWRTTSNSETWPFWRLSPIVSTGQHLHDFIYQQELKPHIFIVAEEAYRNVQGQVEPVNQSLVVSGESGAGKVKRIKINTKCNTKLELSQTENLVICDLGNWSIYSLSTMLISYLLDALIMLLIIINGYLSGGNC